MSMKDKVRTELERIGSLSGGTARLDITHDNRQLTSELTELNNLACAFWRLEVRDAGLAALGVEELKGVGERLASRLTYLLEPIHPIEVDAEQCVVQLRSHPPHKDEDRTSYYELIVKKPGEISLVRYTKQPGDVRRQITAEVTREVFLRLASDLSSATYY